MKKSFRFIALFVATLLTITGLAVVALAEPSDAPLTSESTAGSTEAPVTDPSVSDPSLESSAPSEDTSAPAGDASSEVSAEESETSDVTEPESSEPELSEPAVSEPDVSEPETSEPEVSEPVVSTPEKTEYTITFTVSGNGSVSVYTRNDSLLAKITGGTQAITVSENIYFVIDSGNLQGIDWNEPHRAVDNSGNYYLNPSMDSYVNITFDGTGTTPVPPDTSDEPDTSGDPNSSSVYTIRVNVSSGGTVTAGDRTIGGGNGTNILMKYGESLVFTVAPDEGYELESFKIDGEAVELADGTYTLSDISGSSTVAVTFKTIGSTVAPAGISVTDIDWSVNPVTVDVTGGKAVLREVFDKIATLTPETDKYVAFVSENGTVYVPYGGVSVGTSATVNMSISTLADGEELSAINDIFGGDASAFKAYSFSVAGNALPTGTKMSFKLGSDFANTQTYMLNFDGTKLVEKGDALEVSADGASGMYDYSNEMILVCTANVPGRFTIESILMNVGGNINPLGISDVSAGTDSSYVITATEGYSIKQILIDDVAVENVEGLDNYIHIFENIGENHTIKVEFAADEAASGGDTEDGGNGTVIVVLVIVLVAVLGAAALFIVKWRQEKF